jgi:hypothetical protein
VPPTQSGLWPGLYAPSHGDRGIFERTGKIAGLIFDSFGDFEGFLLETQGAEHKYFSREKAIRELVEWALRERLRVTVWAKRDEPHRALSIVVR